MSKNFERYYNWYNVKKSITEEQVRALCDSGLITNEEMERILNPDEDSKDGKGGE